MTAHVDANRAVKGADTTLHAACLIWDDLSLNHRGMTLIFLKKDFSQHCRHK
jgi:hypothetical protein